MSGKPIRLRRHADGRVALSIDGAWLTIPGEWRKDDLRCAGPGWSELMVAELPESDDPVEPLWTVSRGVELSAYTEGVLIGGVLFQDIDILRIDALKMLAAINACERYRQEDRSHVR